MAGYLTRFTPQSALARFNPMRDFGFDMFDFMRPTGLFDSENIRLDISETEQAYLVKAEMPGIKRDDIKVSIQGDQVSISADIDAQQESNEGNIVCRERYHGKQFRSFTLPQWVDEDNAIASYQDGVLELTLPKKGGGSAKQLTIQ